MIFPTILAIAASELRAQELKAKESSKESQVKDPQTKDLGTHGEIFPIAEKSLLEVIKARLQKLSASGALKEHQATIARKATQQLNRPPVVLKIRKTTHPRSFAYDPSITVPYDLKDHEGTVFHPKGTTVNPLDSYTFRYPFLFVDGDDPEQVAWAIRQHQAAQTLHKPKIILVQGAPFELSQQWGLPVYFDQSGVLIKKLGIAQVPARVSQKEKKLVVEEVEVKAGSGLSKPEELK